MRSTKPSRALLFIAVFFTCIFGAAAACLAFRIGAAAVNVSLLGLGLSLGPCLGAYALAPIRRKQPLRRIVLITGGLSILAFSLLASANLDLEGFFLLLFEGAAGAAIGHTLATLVIGPLLFGRFLCGWGCWRAMVLEFLPLGKGTRRRRVLSRYLPWAGLAACIASAALAFLVFGHHAGGIPGSPVRAGTLALLCGIAVYYSASIALAFAFGDQRAFCKYLCPNLPVLRLTSRLALMKVAANRELCTDCGACNKACPMDIDVRAFSRAGMRIGSGECILCQKCVHVCPSDALSVTFPFRRAASGAAREPALRNHF